jgi:hypothetical protein
MTLPSNHFLSCKDAQRRRQLQINAQDPRSNKKQKENIKEKG